MGPFSNYSAPGVYTQTVLDNSIASLSGSVRIPALIGTADQVQEVKGYELVRGSSATVDNYKVGEVTTPINGRTIQTQSYPLVVGDGMGKVTTNPNNVTVFVNGTQVIVAKVTGSTGQVILALPTKPTDVVTINYYYKKTDTKVTDEDLSDQVKGVTTTFYTHNLPIVDGSNAGKPTTLVGNIIVKINGSIVNVSNLDGVDGNFTLPVPPALTDKLTISYYFNQYAYTADDLPFPNPVQFISVGVSPDTSNFIENVDFAIIGNQIQWGAGFKLIPTVHTAGSEFFDANKIVGTLVDDKIYENVTSQFVTSNNVIQVAHYPIVDGSGRDVTLYDPDMVDSFNNKAVLVYVNNVIVDVNRVDGSAGKVYLTATPLLGATVKVVYFTSSLKDDTFAIEAENSGATGVGRYKITTIEGVRIGNVVLGTIGTTAAPLVTVAFDTGPKVAKGYTIDETVTLTFTDSTNFIVSSSATSAGSHGVGVTGETYIDAFTGLSFTLVSGAYVAGNTIQLNVVLNATFVTSTSILSVPGMRLTVLDTTDITKGDVTDLQVFNKSGKEPNVGDAYYVTYFYAKTNYDCAIYTKFKNVTNDFGALSSSNSLVLAAYLAFLNGAPALIMCQVKKAANSDLAPDQAYYDVLTRLQQDVNGVNPAVILPVTTSGAVINAVSQHCSTQSSMRNRRERISFFGFAVGTEPTDAAAFASGITNRRMISVYPDGAVVELVNADGTVSISVVDGSFLAAAFCGLNVNEAYDVATPMTMKQLVGFTQLVRTMDEPTMDMVAVSGVTIIQKIASTFVIRHGMTTDQSSVLTREIMVVTIADYIQQSTRNVCKQFIGQKMLPSLTGNISNSVGSMLKSAVTAQIIFDYKAVTAQVDPNQPDYIVVTASYIPIFGLNWVGVTYTIRTKF